MSSNSDVSYNNIDIDGNVRIGNTTNTSAGIAFGSPNNKLVIGHTLITQSADALRKGEINVGKTIKTARIEQLDALSASFLDVSANKIRMLPAEAQLNVFGKGLYIEPDSVTAQDQTAIVFTCEGRSTFTGNSIFEKPATFNDTVNVASGLSVNSITVAGSVTIPDNSIQAAAIIGGVGGGGSGGSGATGPAGPTGPAGIAGPTGAKGEIGGPGDNGPTGPQGLQGPTGAQGADSTVQGPTGPQGIQGATGAQGADSTVQGPTGPQGIQGATGADGKVFNVFGYYSNDNELLNAT